MKCVFCRCIYVCSTRACVRACVRACTLTRARTHRRRLVIGTCARLTARSAERRYATSVPIASGATWCFYTAHVHHTSVCVPYTKLCTTVLITVRAVCSDFMDDVDFKGRYNLPGGHLFGWFEDTATHAHASRRRGNIVICLLLSVAIATSVARA